MNLIYTIMEREEKICFIRSELEGLYEWEQVVLSGGEGYDSYTKDEISGILDDIRNGTSKYERELDLLENTEYMTSEELEEEYRQICRSCGLARY